MVKDSFDRIGRSPVYIKNNGIPRQGEYRPCAKLDDRGKSHLVPLHDVQGKKGSDLGEPVRILVGRGQDPQTDVAQPTEQFVMVK